MKDYTITAELTMHIEQDFQQITTELKSQHFLLNRDGYLVYQSPFVNPGDENKLTFKFKPKVQGSPIYSVIFEGRIDHVAGVLHNAFRTYTTKLCMIQVNLHMENYSQAAFNKLVKSSTNWEQAAYDQNIFTLPHAHFHASCLLMSEHICFMTRSINSFEAVNDFINTALEHVKLFKPELEFNLFTCAEF